MMCYSIHGNRSTTRTLKRQKKKTLKTCTFVTIANMNTAAAVVEHTQSSVGIITVLSEDIVTLLKQQQKHLFFGLISYDDLSRL